MLETNNKKTEKNTSVSFLNAASFFLFPLFSFPNVLKSKYIYIHMTGGSCSVKLNEYYSVLLPITISVNIRNHIKKCSTEIFFNFFYFPTGFFFFVVSFPNVSFAKMISRYSTWKKKVFHFISKFKRNKNNFLYNNLKVSHIGENISAFFMHTFFSFIICSFIKVFSFCMNVFVDLYQFVLCWLDWVKGIEFECVAAFFALSRSLMNFPNACKIDHANWLRAFMYALVLVILCALYMCACALFDWTYIE